MFTNNRGTCLNFRARNRRREGKYGMSGRTTGRLPRDSLSASPPADCLPLRWEAKPAPGWPPRLGTSRRPRTNCKPALDGWVEPLRGIQRKGGNHDMARKVAVRVDPKRRRRKRKTGKGAAIK